MRIERRHGDGQSVGAADGGRRHGRGERLSLEPLRLGRIEGRSAEQRGDRAGRFLAGLVRAVSRRPEPRSERLPADSGRSLPRHGRAARPARRPIATAWPSGPGRPRPARGERDGRRGGALPRRQARRASPLRQRARVRYRRLPPPAAAPRPPPVAPAASGAEQRSARRDGRAGDGYPGLHRVRRRRGSRPAPGRQRSRTRRSPPRSPPRRPARSSASPRAPMRSSSRPGEKYFTLAGGFQRGQQFHGARLRRATSPRRRGAADRSSASRIPGPRATSCTAIDGFEITGYSQAIVRDIYYVQRFDITNNHIHGNRCPDPATSGSPAPASRSTTSRAGSRATCSGTTPAAAAAPASCGDEAKAEFGRRRAQPGRRQCRHRGDDSHGGAVYLFGKTLRVTGNLFTNNTVTGWGGGLYVGAWTDGRQFTTATLTWNVYRGQPRRHRRRRLLLRRWRDLHELARGLRPQLRRQHLSRRRR